MNTKEWDKNKMEKKPIIDVERALAEKEQQQKIFVREHGYPSSVLTLVIAHWGDMKR